MNGLKNCHWESSFVISSLLVYFLQVSNHSNVIISHLHLSHQDHFPLLLLMLTLILKENLCFRLLFSTMELKNSNFLAIVHTNFILISLFSIAINIVNCDKIDKMVRFILYLPALESKRSRVDPRMITNLKDHNYYQGQLEELRRAAGPIQVPSMMIIHKDFYPFPVKLIPKEWRSEQKLRLLVECYSSDIHANEAESAKQIDSSLVHGKMEKL
jgi:hypothetical protein